MLVYLLIITSILIFITVYDLKYQIIPNKSIVIGILVTLSYSIIQYLYFSQNQSIQHSVLENAIGIDFINIALGAIVGSGLLFLVVLASRGKGMGMGDVKFAILMGLILGFPQILVALYIAIIVGAILGITAIITKKAKMKTAIPFGPFLVLGTFVTMLWGGIILEYINQLFF
jgi:prepilin signal peptidase PulO-like enzyme (type II secretory pathway)